MSSAAHDVVSPARARLAFGSYVLDPLRVELMQEGRLIPLRRKAFDLLLALTSRPGQVLGKDELLAEVWPGVVVGEDSLTQCVHELRSALGPEGAAYVRTVLRRGYRFDAEVRKDRRPASAGGAATAPDPRSAEAPETVVGAATTMSPPASMSTRRRLLTVSAVLVPVALGIVVVARQRASAPPALNAPARSIVLLPLVAEEGGETPPWFAEALTADLTDELGRLQSTLVISRNTAATWKGKPADPREVAQALGVRYVVRGSVRRVGEQVRLALTLVDGELGTEPWANRFELERARLGAAMDDVVQQIARQLDVQMYRANASRAAALSPAQVQADDLAMQGWGYYFRGLTRENLAAALALFEQAVAQDPRSVSGWGGVAVINTLGVTIAWRPDRDAAIARLDFATARLQEIDPEHLYALLARSNQASVHRDFEAYVEISRMMIARFPNFAPAYASVGIGMLNLGHFDEVVEPIEKAARLSPRDPSLGGWYWNLGTSYFMRERYADAAHFALVAEQASPRLPLPPLLRAASLARSGHGDEARAIVDRYRQQHPDYRAADIAKIMRSDNPAYAAGRERMAESLRGLGLP